MDKKELENIKKLLQDALLKVDALLGSNTPPPPPAKETPLKNLVVYLNAGHGGIDPHSGKYRTFPDHGKFYQFVDGAGKITLTAYEGQTNRIFANMVAEKLMLLGAEVVKTYHPIEDRYNQDRALIANGHWEKAKSVGKRGLWLSFHSNALGAKHKGESIEARGLCIFTTRGNSEADAVAAAWDKAIRDKTKGFNIQYRGLHEANFDELVLTAMPAVLVENLFFTNIEDARLLLNADYQKAITDATIDMLVGYYAPKVI